MAGIIGQLTANARRRKDTKRIRSDKCMYNIPEFDRNGFSPDIHNNYVKNRVRLEGKKIDEEQEAMVVQEKKMVNKI
jgi:hypothetical protein